MHTELVADDAEQGGSRSPANGEPSPAKAKTDLKPWRPWTIAVADLGHGALALLSAVLFAVGMANTARRRPAALAALAIIPVGIGWFSLLGRLAAIA
jgi:hypothetical protein